MGSAQTWLQGDYNTTWVFPLSLLNVLLATWLKVYAQIHTYSQKKKEPKKKIIIVIIVSIKELNANLKVTHLYFP